MSTPVEKWTVGRLLNWTKDYLTKQGVENPRLEAEVLLAHARGCKRIELYVAFDEEPPEAVKATFRDLVRRRAAGTPVAYLVGHREFYSLDFEVTPDVLIPRPETELLVVAMLDFAKGQGATNGEQGNTSASTPMHFRIADIGTGSGILAVCAAKYLPAAHITAIDISPRALAAAKRNAERHGVADRITFVESNLFAAVPTGEEFDIIVSNPPYVSTAEMAELPSDVRDYEPHLALEAGAEGTAVIAPLIEQAAKCLRPGGLLAIEVSPMIAERVEQVFRANDVFTLLPTVRDLAGYARVVQAFYN